MNGKLKKLAGRMILCGLALLFLAAMRSDGGLGPGLGLSAAGGLLCLTAAGLGFLCSHRGLRWRRARFGTVPHDFAAEQSELLVFPKAG